MGILTIIAPKDAACGLYPQTPKNLKYSLALDPQKKIPATGITEGEKTISYHYTDLTPGLYHCGASMEGYNALCRMINYTGENMCVAMELHKLAGNGYEAGYEMRYTREFTEANLASGKDTWGQEYAKLFATPQFLRAADRPGRHQQTTNEEMLAFITKLAEKNGNMYIYCLGKSPKYGYDMPLVLFTRENLKDKTLVQAAEILRNNGKPTVQYTAQVHSTEPASCEGALAMMLQLCGDYDKTLDTVDVYIIPRVNPDGAYEAIRYAPATGVDMNRDYLYMQNEEIRMITGAYNLFLPEVAIDGHEKMPSILKPEDMCSDMEVQTGAGSLNHPAVMTKLVVKMALEAMKKAKSLGLRTRFYGNLASAAGGAAGSSYFGTRNSLSFLVETPGQLHLGMALMERRVLAQYVLASSVIDYTVAHAAEIMETVHNSRTLMQKKGAIYDENDLMILEHANTETGRWATPLLNVTTGKVSDPDFSEGYLEQVSFLHARPRPTAYVIPKGQCHEEEIFRVANNHAIAHYELPQGSRIKLRQYVQKEDRIELADEQIACFETGAYVFPNTLPSTILNVIMEPDFASSYGRKMTLFSMGLIEADPEGKLPVFRYCHDLTDGKVSLESK